MLISWAVEYPPDARAAGSGFRPPLSSGDIADSGHFVFMLFASLNGQKRRAIYP